MASFSQACPAKLPDRPARPRKVEPVRFQNADGVGPETMAFRPGQFGQYALNSRHCQARKRISGLAEDAQASVFRDGARRPSVLPVVLEPEMRGRVKLVCGIDERNQDVDVQQSRLLSHYSSSSRSLLTSSPVTTGPWGRRGSTGMPLRYSSLKFLG
jgi:hypothetical protein